MNMVAKYRVTYKGGGWAGVLESAGSDHLLQGHLGLDACDCLGVRNNVAVATRDGEDVLRPLLTHVRLMSAGKLA